MARTPERKKDAFAMASMLAFDKKALPYLLNSLRAQRDHY
jgi:hypothetical protein